MKLVYWCRTCGGGKNFGDQLTPALLRHFGIRFTWWRAERAHLVMVGSILSKVPNGWAGTILGTGFIQEGMWRDLRRARVLTIRGSLSAGAAKLSARTPLGDAGVLAPLLTDRVGAGGVLAIPHTVDHELAVRHPDARLVSITLPPAEVVAAVRGAEFVYTSSLHALILADALGIPHVLEPHERVKGGLWKFLDYASAFDETIVPGVPRLTNRAAMAERQVQLQQACLSLRG